MGAPWGLGALGPGPPGPLDKTALAALSREMQKVIFFHQQKWSVLRHCRGNYANAMSDVQKADRSLKCFDDLQYIIIIQYIYYGLWSWWQHYRYRPGIIIIIIIIIIKEIGSTASLKFSSLIPIKSSKYFMKTQDFSTPPSPVVNISTCAQKLRYPRCPDIIHWVCSWWSRSVDHRRRAGSHCRASGRERPERRGSCCCPGRPVPVRASDSQSCSTAACRLQLHLHRVVSLSVSQCQLVSVVFTVHRRWYRNRYLPPQTSCVLTESVCFSVNWIPEKLLIKSL